MERDPGKAKQETTKTADHMSTESDKSPNGVCSFVLFFLFFYYRGFCMVSSRWPETRKSKKDKKNNTADHMSTESDKSPNGVCSFVFLCFFWFSRLLHGLLQMARTSKIQKKNCRPHVHEVRQEPQWGLQFCFFVFFFWIFEVLAIWSRPCKNIENQKKKSKTADHMSTESRWPEPRK